MTGLFDYDPVYPDAPGYKEGDTSRAAAESMKPTAKVLQSKCLKALAVNPMTPDETADFLGENILSIRPRFSELREAGKIIDTNLRRKNASGRSAKVWAVA